MLLEFVYRCTVSVQRVQSGLQCRIVVLARVASAHAQVLVPARSRRQ